jgi:hypothetical protein
VRGEIVGVALAHEVEEGWSSFESRTQTEHAKLLEGWRDVGGGGWLGTS